MQVLDADKDDEEDSALFVTDDAEKNKLKEGSDEEHDENMEVRSSLRHICFIVSS